jgi:hypothetical protein
MSIDLHLVSSLSTAGSLRWAIREQLLTGEVFCTQDIPELGPLDNGIKRMEFLSGLGYNYQYEEEGIEPLEKDAFKVWELLNELLKQTPVDRIVLWIDSTGSDYVFLRMACYFLKNQKTAIVLVPVPVNNDVYSSAAFPPEVLAPLIKHAVVLSEIYRNQLALEYEQIVARPELLRECDENGKLIFKDISVHDHLLIENCDETWLTASRVVDSAMGTCDPRNSLGDAFLSSRLEHLILEGYIEADGPRTALRFFNVRLPQ